MGQILVVGYRQGLIDALNKRNMDFAVWSGKTLEAKPRSYRLIEDPYPDSLLDFGKTPQFLGDIQAYSAIIPATEKAVALVAGLHRLIRRRNPSPMDLLRCHDKILMKSFLGSHGIAMTPFLRYALPFDPQTIAKALGYPVVCKDRDESGGRSFMLCHTLKDIKASEARGRIYERFIDAPEFSVESFRHQGETVFTNITEYFQKGHINILPAVLTPPAPSKILELNRKVLDLLNIDQGMAHLEIYMTKSGPVFGEIAIRPPGGYIMELIEIAYGFCAWNAYIDLHLNIKPELSSRALRSAAVQVLHPGEGQLQSIRGWRSVNRDKSVVKAKMKITTGVQVDRRHGVGDDIGYVLQSEESYAELLEAIERIRQKIRFELVS